MLVADLRDVKQRILAREDFNKGAKLGKAYHLGVVDLTDLHILRDGLDDLNRFLCHLIVNAEDEDPSIFLDIDLNSCLIDDLIDHFTLWPNDFPYLLHIDTRLEDLRRIGGHGSPRL